MDNAATLGVLSSLLVTFSLSFLLPILNLMLLTTLTSGGEGIGNGTHEPSLFAFMMTETVLCNFGHIGTSGGGVAI